MFEIRCDKKGNWAEIADAVYVETAQCEALSAELVFAGEAEIRRLNRETRAVDRVTDVLSYPTLDGIRGKTLKLRDFPFLFGKLLHAFMLGMTVIVVAVPISMMIRGVG